MFRESRKRKRKNPSMKVSLKQDTVEGNPPEMDALFSVVASIVPESDQVSTVHSSPSTSAVAVLSKPLCTSPKRNRKTSMSKRSVSPARFFRAREQSELQNLNDRLSSHLDTVNRLQSENASLKLQMQGMDVLRLQAQTRKQFHDSDVETLQQLLDTARQENDRLDNTLQCARKERDKLSESLTEKEEDVALMEIQIQSLKSITQQYEKQQDDLKSLQDSLKEKQEDACRLSDELVKEKVARKRMEEELEMNKSRYIKEIQETSIRMNEHLEHTDQKLEAGYEKLVSDALSSVREQNVRELDALREELTTVYQNKLNDWKIRAERSNADLLSSKKELKTSKSELEHFHAQMTRLKMDSAGLKVQVEEEQAKNRKLKDDSEKEVCHMQREMVLLKQELSEVKDELEEMGGANMRLEQEINTYRVLLEDLETKNCYTSPCKTPPKHEGDRSKHDLNSNAISLESPAIFVRTNQLDHGIRIESVDTGGRFMTIINTTDHLVDMCLWMIKQSSYSNVVAYEIPCNTPLMSEQRLVVWSHGEGPFVDKPNSDEILSLPDDIDTREFFRITNGTDNDGGIRRPAIDAIHINMIGKKWMSRPSSMNMRLEDGDGQLQSKSDFTIHNQEADDTVNSQQHHNNTKNTTKEKTRVKSKSSYRKRGNRSQSVTPAGRIAAGYVYDVRAEPDTSRASDWHGNDRNREFLQSVHKDENGRLHKDGCVVM